MTDTVEFTAYDLLGQRIRFGVGSYLAKGILHLDENGAYVPWGRDRKYLEDGTHIIPIILGEIVKLKVPK